MPSLAFSSSKAIQKRSFILQMAEASVFLNPLMDEIPLEARGITQRESLEQEKKHGVTYTELSQLSLHQWVSIIFRFLLAVGLTLLILIFLWPYVSRGRCRNISMILLVFFLMLLLVGNMFLRNLAVFVLSAILLTGILSVFIFFIYDLTQCTPRTPTPTLPPLSPS